jgi:hypothetical protein
MLTIQLKNGAMQHKSGEARRTSPSRRIYAGLIAGTAGLFRVAGVGLLDIAAHRIAAGRNRECAKYGNEQSQSSCEYH